jgi:hypothetical protein
MSRRSTTFTLVILGSFLVASLAQAATSGTSNVILAAQATANITITDASVTLSPSAADYVNNFVEVTGASGIHVQVKTNSSTGMILKVKCADASPAIALADLLVRTQTAAGTGGTTMSSYTAITAADQNLWTTTVHQNAFLTIATDVKVQNIFNYDDPAAAGVTNYTNTLTYTVVTQ